MDLLCPNCRSAASAIEVNGERRCHGCGYKWAAAPFYPPPPRYPAPRASNGRSTGMIVAVVAIAVIVGAVFVVLATGANPDTSDATTYYSEPAPAAPAEPQEAPAAPKAELGARATGVTSGWPWWLVEYRNTGTVAITFPRVNITYTDAAGGDLEPEYAVSNVYSLPPGKSAWILITQYKSKDTAARIEIDSPQPVNQWTPVTIELELSDFFVEKPDANGFTYLRGKLRNTSRQAMSFVLIQGIGFDAAGQPCAYSLGYPDDRAPKAGAFSNFRVEAGVWQNSIPERWEIHAWGTLEE